jgi:hypothetical protein
MTGGIALLIQERQPVRGLRNFCARICHIFALSFISSLAISPGLRHAKGFPAADAARLVLHGKTGGESASIHKVINTLPQDSLAAAQDSPKSVIAGVAVGRHAGTHRGQPPFAIGDGDPIFLYKRESITWFSKSKARLLPNDRASLQDAIYTQPFQLVFAEQGMKCSFNIFSR